MPPREIYIQARQDLSDEQLLQMPSYSGVQRQVELQREIPGRKEVDARDIWNIVIEGQFATDYNGQRFLLFDSRQQEPDEVVIVIFATDLALQRLRTYRIWNADGTFKVTPSNFLQLWTLNIIVDQSSIACAYVLMGNKAYDTYRRALTIINGHLNGIAPESVNMDFEQAPKRAIVELWPNVQIKLCLFHLGQSILRRVQREGLIAQYERDENVRKYIRSLASLSILRVDQVEEAFLVLEQRAPIVAQPIYEYFRRTYILADAGNQPIFPIPLRNHHGSVLLDQARTNNAIEGYHRTLRSRFPSPKPLLSRLIIVLKDEERFMQDRIRVYELDPTRGVSTRPRAKKYKSNDLALKHLVENFDLIQNPTAEQIITHLRAVQYRLAGNNFDQWDD